MTDWVTAVLIVLSTLFMLIASIGIIRMPDVYARLQVTTKGATLGAGLVLLAIGIYFATIPMFTRAMLGIAFLALTQPIAAHMIGRAAYIGKADLWNRTVVNDLEGSPQLTIAPGSGPVTTQDILEALVQEGADDIRPGTDPTTTTPETRS